MRKAAASMIAEQINKRKKNFLFLITRYVLCAGIENDVKTHTDGYVKLLIFALIHHA